MSEEKCCDNEDKSCGWKKGAPPMGTFNWGGVMIEGEATSGFHFADFHGDHITLPMDGNRRVEFYDVAFWNNCLSMPPVSVLQS